MGDSIKISKPLTGKTIMVNPGHGGHLLILDKNGKPDHYAKSADPGAIAFSNGNLIKESELNDEVAGYLVNDLKEMGANVILADNMDRIDVKNYEDKTRPDAFVSIHHDAYSGGRFPDSGETVLGWGTSLPFAKKIDEKLKADETIPNNKLNPDWAKELAVLKADPSTVSALVEVGHMNVPSELKALMSPEYQQTAAKNIAEGIADYFKDQKEEETKKTIEQLLPKWSKNNSIFNQ